MGESDVLTPREREVLALMAVGRTNADISRELGISFPTAKSHVSSILAKAGAASREEAVHFWNARSGGRAHTFLWPVVLFATLAAAAGVGVAALLSYISGEDDPAPHELRVDLSELTPGVPRHFSADGLGVSPFGTPLGLFVTRFDNGKVNVFFDRDPHTGCPVAWHPDYPVGDFFGAGDEGLARTGAYKDGCGGWVYVIEDARIVFGASPRGLDSFLYTIDGEEAVIELDRVALGICNSGPPDVGCSPAGGSLPVIEEGLPTPMIPDWGKR